MAGAFFGAVLDWSGNSVPPAGPGPSAATLPDTLFDIPRNTPDIADDPLGGPASIAYAGPEIRTGIWGGSREVPIVVGAERDVVRAVRDLEGAHHFTLAPDGTKIAAASQVSASSGERTTVLVADLTNGRTAQYELPDGRLGSEVERLTWTPDGRALAVDARVVTEQIDELSYRSEDRHLLLDVRSGEWAERTREAPLAFSPNGDREIRLEDYTDLVVARPDGPAVATLNMPVIDRVRVEVRGQTAAFAPDARLVAIWGARSVAGPPDGSNPHSIEVFDAATGAHSGSVDLGGLGGGGIIGWGSEGLVIWVPHRDQGTRIERLDLTDITEVSREVVVGTTRGADGLAITYWTIGVPQTLLDADARPAEAPVAPYDWVPWLPWLASAVLLVLAWWVARARGLPRASHAE